MFPTFPSQSTDIKSPRLEAHRRRLAPVPAVRPLRRLLPSGCFRLRADGKIFKTVLMKATLQGR
jgi:hypothetical protein